MKQLHLTGITTKPNSQGQEKLDKAKNSKKNTDEPQGFSKEWYTSQNLRPPPDAEDDEIEYDEFGNIYLEDEDVEDVGVAISIPLDMYAGAEGLVDGGTNVYTKNGLVFNVAEEIYEIDDYVYYLTASWWTKKKASIKVWWELKFSQNKENNEE